MKKCLAVCLTAVIALLTGCVVTSVCPYYTQKDLVLEPAILGTWTNVNSQVEVWRFEQREGFAYRFTIVEPAKTTIMEAHAFKLQGQVLDIFSLEQDYHVIPAHYLLRVSRLAPTLRFSELNETWIKELLEREPNAVRHHFVQTGEKPKDRRVVLTGDTPELQKFLITHLNTKPAWKQSVELRRDSSVIKTAQMKGKL